MKRFKRWLAGRRASRDLEQYRKGYSWAMVELMLNETDPLEVQSYSETAKMMGDYSVFDQGADEALRHWVKLVELMSPGTSLFRLPERDKVLDVCDRRVKVVIFTQPKNNEETSMKHNHKEAFCLMYYACKGCGHFERIWNSRDGVTPFGVKCPSCEAGIMDHAYFGSDQYAPEHKLLPGQKFFRDGTNEEAEGIMRKRIAAF